MNAVMTIDALLDSNVVIAMVAEAHEHHVPSLAIRIEQPAMRLAVSAHSYAETYSTLTRQGGRGPFRFTPSEAWAALESIRSVTELIGLTPPQTFDAVRKYADSGGIGARLYDRLIGETALIHDIPQIITWNASHMRGLFPKLKIVTPAELLRAH